MKKLVIEKFLQKDFRLIRQTSVVILKISDILLMKKIS